MGSAIQLIFTAIAPTATLPKHTHSTNPDLMDEWPRENDLAHSLLEWLTISLSKLRALSKSQNWARPDPVARPDILAMK